MANRLVPYIQDVNQWTNYYIQRARNQKHPGDMMKEVKSCNITPNLIAPQVQLVAQAKSDLVEQKADLERVRAPIKAQPDFKTPLKRSKTSNPSGRKGKRTTSTNSEFSKIPTKRKRKNKLDIFD